MGSLVLGENTASAAILSQDALGLKFNHQHFFPLQNAVPRSAFGAVSELGPRWGPPELARGGLLGPLHKASTGQISLLREGEHVWSWFPAAETTSQAAVPKEPEAAHTLLGPMGSQGLREN